jgi:ADP-ribose pyrophosphatase YjhB (NUDIX family)
MESVFQIRVTGVLVEQDKLLLVKQRVSASRAWSLPGGRVEQGETLEQALVREMAEETGLDVTVDSLLYLCEKLDAVPPLIHVTFRVSRIGGLLRLPSNEFDKNPISDVRMVPIRNLPSYDLSERFTDLTLAGFPEAGSYKGDKANIGLT